MRPTLRRLWALASAAALVTAAVGTAVAAGPTATYRVTIQVLADGQPLTPPLIALHRSPQADVFTVGATASFGVKEIAENGNLGPLTSALESTKGVLAVTAALAPLVPLGSPGAGAPHNFTDTVIMTISAHRDARAISWVSMLICTNDAFTGVDSLALPKQVGDAVARFTAGYDAGTEDNTEAFRDIVPPCQGLIGVTGDAGTGLSNPALAEGGVIHHHPGILGGEDLTTEDHGWTDPVGLIVVERIG